MYICIYQLYMLLNLLYKALRSRRKYKENTHNPYKLRLEERNTSGSRPLKERLGCWSATNVELRFCCASLTLNIVRYFQCILLDSATINHCSLVFCTIVQGHHKSLFSSSLSQWTGSHIVWALQFTVLLDRPTISHCSLVHCLSGQGQHTSLSDMLASQHNKLNYFPRHKLTVRPLLT